MDIFSVLWHLFRKAQGHRLTCRGTVAEYQLLKKRGVNCYAPIADLSGECSWLIDERDVARANKILGGA